MVSDTLPGAVEFDHVWLGGERLSNIAEHQPYLNLEA